MNNLCVCLFSCKNVRPRRNDKGVDLCISDGDGFCILNSPDNIGNRGVSVPILYNPSAGSWKDSKLTRRKLNIVSSSPTTVAHGPPLFQGSWHWITIDETGQIGKAEGTRWTARFTSQPLVLPGRNFLNRPSDLFRLGYLIISILRITLESRPCPNAKPMWHVTHWIHFSITQLLS